MMRLLASSAAITMFAAVRLPAQHDTTCMSSTMDHGTMDHASHQMNMSSCGAALPVVPAQAAYAALGEVVRLLKADPTTDWSKVNLEALRQHFMDMDEVVLHADVAQANVPGGLEMTITGTGRTVAAIKRMLQSHATMLSQEPAYHARAEVLPNGVRLTVTARDAADTRRVALIRGEGFAGLITEGDHHAKHHLMIARGDAAAMSMDH